MSNKRVNILFVHSAGKTAQFFPVCEYLQAAGIANTFFLAGRENYGNEYNPSRHFSLEPDGDANTALYYYTWYAEIATKISLGILKKVEELETTNGIHFDCILGHYVYGSLNLLYDEVKTSLITYIEYPSFRHHRWDPQYPPTRNQILNDKAYEMLSYYHLIKSSKVIVPSKYVKNMIPKGMRGNVTVIPDGFLTNQPFKLDSPFVKDPKLTYVGFSAKTLSSEKGFEQFVKISKELTLKDPNFRFIVIGGHNGNSYGHEKTLLDQLGYSTFTEYLFQKYQVDKNKYTFTGFLEDDNIKNYYQLADIFLYPLQFGSGNWIFYEVLSLGVPIIASNRCFVPEVIKNGYNGILCDYDNIPQWIEKILWLKNHLEERRKLAKNAIKSSKKYYVEKIAMRYFDTIQKTLAI